MLAMKKVNTHEAKTQFSRLLKKVELGKPLEIARRGSVVARIVPDSDNAKDVKNLKYPPTATNAGII